MSTTRHEIVGVGIAGLGRSGWDIHAATLRKIPNKYKIVAVTDLIPDRMQEAAEQLHCRTYPDFDSLLKDKEVELQIVATPNHLHPAHTIAALKAGKQVVCEKPMAITAAQADEMIAAATEAKRILAVFQNRRYAADFIKVRDVIQSGKLGRIVMIRIAIHGFSRRWDWQTLKKSGGGSLYNTGPHFLDQALQLFGDAEPEVFCQMERALISGDAEDHVKLILRAPGAPMIDLEVTSACAYPRERWLVMGTRGGLTGTGTSLRWKYVDFDAMPSRPVDRSPIPDRSYNDEDLVWHEETWDQDPEIPRLPFYMDLYKTLREGALLVITPESVRRQIAIIEKCHELNW